MKLKLLGGLIAIVAAMISTGANAATVSVNPAAVSVDAGQQFTITISADFSVEGSLIDAAGFLLSYDTNLLSVVSSGMSSEASAAGFFADEFGGPGAIDVSLGTFGAGVASVSNLYTFTFLVAADAVPGTSTTALLDIGLIGDVWSVDRLIIATADITFNGAEIQVNNIPIPAAVWLLGSGLVGLVGVARRRRSSSSSAVSFAMGTSAAALS